jgi:hypothetical protein
MPTPRAPKVQLDQWLKGYKRFANNQFLANVEKAAQRYESWIESRSPGKGAAMRQFMKQLRDQRAKAAKA